jgi:hypothetical protein
MARKSHHGSSVKRLPPEPGDLSQYIEFHAVPEEQRWHSSCAVCKQPMLTFGAARKIIDGCLHLTLLCERCFVERCSPCLEREHGHA